jgi:dolichol-phosphate mannosyltransferase
MKKISIVVPCFNEEAVIALTLQELYAFVKSEPNYEFDLIIVDDGSQDRTAEIISAALSQNTNTSLISLTRNFGHQSAVSAGLDNARGDAVVVIDADLQDPPIVISDMIRSWEAGYKVVYGRRVKRLGETFFKQKTAKYFYKFLNFFSDVEIPRDVGDFQLIDSTVADVLRGLSEHNKFYRGLISWTGFKSISVEYVRNPRKAGKTKYSFLKMVSFATNAVLSFSVKPLNIMVISGTALSAIALLGAVYFSLMKILDIVDVQGWTALIVAMLFLGGVQIFSLGIVGLYVGKIFTESQGRPTYIIKSEE